MCHSRRSHHRQHDAAGFSRRSDAMRASDADRERAASLLREHASAGRLTFDELEDRLERAQTARFVGDLRPLTADLPRLRLPQERRRRASAELREHVSWYLGVMAMLVVIWAMTGAGYFWPIWPALGWGIGVASHVAAAAPVMARGRRTARLRA